MAKVSISALFFCLVVVLGCGKEPQGAKDKLGEKDSKDKPAAEMVLVAAEATKDLDDPEKWNERVDKYLGKPMMVEGVVDIVGSDKGKIYLIALAGHGPGRHVQCRFNPPPKQEPDQIKKGQKIKVRGECNGAGLTGLTLQECTIVELGEAPKKEPMTPKADDKKSVTALKELGAKLSMDTDGCVCDVTANQNQKLKDADLALLAGLPQLKSVNLTDTAISDEGLRHLAGLTGLTDLYLGGTKVTDKGMTHLEGLKLQGLAP
jgi:hypothetical protein